MTLQLHFRILTEASGDWWSNLPLPNTPKTHTDFYTVYSNEDYLIQLLTEGGHLTSEHVAEIRGKLGDDGLVQHFLDHGDITETSIAEVSASNVGTHVIDLSSGFIDPAFKDFIPLADCRRFNAVPFRDENGYLDVALADVLDFEAQDAIPHIVNRECQFYAAPPKAIRAAWEQIFGDEVGQADANELQVMGDIGSDDSDAPVIKLVSGILVDAFKMRASDIHIEPLETSLRIRNRLDGKLIEAATHPKKLLPAVIARLKVMSGSMSIAEKRLPQDGRIQVKMGGKEVDLRVSSVPSNHGESIVMRILDKSALSLGLPQLGFLSDDQAVFAELLRLPDGIILVTGPTGSGKTTTLYACLNEINKPDKKIITVEDPVEYELAGINQVMVRSEVGMTFAAALRSMLRQAPNIIMVGEIRDGETANIAINASLTGHLVFSTLHTNDAPSSVARLADMGIKKFLIASAVRAILAQRLVRKLCDKCKVPATLDEKELRALNIDPAQLAESNIMGPGGCEHCRDTGYRGRIGIFEIFLVDDEVRHLINQDLSSPQLRRRARELGMRTLREDGIRKVLVGMTSAAEVIGVTMADAD
ncbi:MAG: Flp pilus assembly complex ATPase component TadA [Akkermansiaceae bacterium]|nr:Flp pilus assembly complex ATPase component TadA [Akkermansiaceae bacterium]